MAQTLVLHGQNSPGLDPSSSLSLPTSDDSAGPIATFAGDRPVESMEVDGIHVSRTNVQNNLIFEYQDNQQNDQFHQQQQNQQNTYVDGRTVAVDAQSVTVVDTSGEAALHASHQQEILEVRDHATNVVMGAQASAAAASAAAAMAENETRHVREQAAAHSEAQAEIARQRELKLKADADSRINA